MKLINNIRLKNKIILIIVIIGTVSSITGNLVNYFYEISQTRQRLISDTQLHARLISEYCSLPLEFNYPENAKEVLQKLSIIESVCDGILYTSGDTVFAEYHRDQDRKLSMPPSLKTIDYFMADNYIHVRHLVQSKQGNEGYIYLRSKINWQSYILRQFISTLGLTVLMVLIIFLMAFYFERSISAPIIKLTRQMKLIANSDNYTLTENYQAKDEIGELYTGFNFMIDRIKIREKEKLEVLKELKISETQYQNLYENAPVMYISVEIASAKIIRYNYTLCRITGYSKDELIGRNIFEIYHLESQEKLTEVFNQFEISGSISNQEFKILKKNGETLNISVDSSAEYDENGNIIYSRSVWRDISEQKQAQDAEKEALAETKRLLEIADRSRRALLSVVEDEKIARNEISKLNQNLEQKVIERTSQLNAANKELETFTYSVSHDLKAPLRGIDGYSKLLLDNYSQNLNEEASHFINTIRSSTLQMNQLIEDLLQYSRLERSQMQVKPLKIRAVIETILKMNEDEIEANHFSVVLNVPDTEVIADSKGIQIALRNLIGNAIKFSKASPAPEINIGLEENPGYWIISVKDNGIGFDMKYNQRIFEIFQRLQRAEDYPGTGIGLAMVAKAMLRMNGKARADSVPGQGATFYLEIPKTNQ